MYSGRRSSAESVRLVGTVPRDFPPSTDSLIELATSWSNDILSRGVERSSRGLRRAIAFSSEHSIRASAPNSEGDALVFCDMAPSTLSSSLRYNDVKLDISFGCVVSMRMVSIHRLKASLLLSPDNCLDRICRLAATRSRQAFSKIDESFELACPRYPFAITYDLNMSEMRLSAFVIGTRSCSLRLASRDWQEESDLHSVSPVTACLVATSTLSMLPPWRGRSMQSTRNALYSLL
mmetsp:Transcript_54327/g.110879  ORF Transcript_54327/g.110879 Transcript_54327/m.110879 type:complete len:235 (+) Transcript_54327:342-1046(+)